MCRSFVGPWFVLCFYCKNSDRLGEAGGWPFVPAVQVDSSPFFIVYVWSFILCYPYDRGEAHGADNQGNGLGFAI